MQKDNKEEMQKLMCTCMEIKDDMKNSLFQFKMETAKVDKYFPAKTNDDIYSFLEEDSEFAMRRRGFHELLKTVATTTKKDFSMKLLSTLFSLEYKRNKRWPSTQKMNPSDEYVPDIFIAFLKSSLTRMAGLGYIKDEFIDLDFWKSLPSKFRSFKFYGKKVITSRPNFLHSFKRGIF